MKAELRVNRIYYKRKGRRFIRRDLFDWLYFKRNLAILAPTLTPYSKGVMTKL